MVEQVSETRGLTMRSSGRSQAGVSLLRSFGRSRAGFLHASSYRGAVPLSASAPAEEMGASRVHGHRGPKAALRVLVTRPPHRSTRPTGSDVVTSNGVWHVEWNELHAGYVHDVHLALVRRELRPTARWMTSFLPRSASILLEPDWPEVCVLALSWDEESGWRFGTYVEGDERCPTLLRDQRYFGGDVLPDPTEVGDTVVAIVRAMRRPRRWWQQREPETRWGWRYPPSYRTYRDLHDGFDDRLRAHLPPDDPTAVGVWSGDPT